MPTAELSRPETLWPWINSDQDTMIEEMKKELEKNGGRKITIDQYELSSTETKSLDPKTLTWTTINSSSSPELYKQIDLQSSTDGTVPILKQNHFKVSNGNINIDSESMSSASPIGEIKYNRPESSLSQAISIDMASNRSTSRSRDRSVSPRRSRSEKNVSIGGITEHVDEYNYEKESSTNQEYYSHRDSSHGKPLPGDNGFIHSSWSHGIDHDRVSPHSSRSVTSPAPPRSRSSSPSQWAIVERSQTHEIKRSPTPALSTAGSTAKSTSSLVRPSSVPPFDATLITLPRYKKVISQPSSPLPDYLTKLRHIKVATVPVPVPPKFGTLTQGGRWPNEAQGPVDIGPPCELCKKPITDTRFIHHEGFLYHVEHFTCSYCFKSLRPKDFMTSSDNKPYCVNCFKREFP
ncbi:uncharacterized protein LOC107369309 [Tetranychus urticae]|uniref:LIM zinc-binding domain-containing protein n=1 Tax=Tetranychus urticae TaxID=32264 RepID=T1L1D3_TETUR|nr:uncharacterized protein LOC107369309 [Tetranychus urticae]XP_015792760.1 uncharacterized protein LOC107369309 [Tetranychus urticae]